jgi:8-oxo-dGTP pyrophosphatase MutT (NUDIX family)
MVIVREKDRENPKWKFPGGGIEEGEYPLDAAIRELRQETGLSLTGQDLRFVFKVPKINHNLYVYLGRVSSWSNLLAIGEDNGETRVVHYHKIFEMDDFLRVHQGHLNRLLRDYPKLLNRLFHKKKAKTLP